MPDQIGREPIPMEKKSIPVELPPELAARKKAEFEANQGLMQAAAESAARSTNDRVAEARVAVESATSDEGLIDGVPEHLKPQTTEAPKHSAAPVQTDTEGYGIRDEGLPKGTEAAYRARIGLPPLGERPVQASQPAPQKGLLGRFRSLFRR